METIRVGLIQIRTKKFDLNYNFEQSCKMIRRAALKGAQIVVTPESMLDGYSFREKEFQEHPQKYSLTIDDNRIKEYCSLALEIHCNLLIGLTLRESEGTNILYRNTILIINNHGELLGKYYKVHTEYQSKEFEFYKHGEGYPVFDLPVGNGYVPIGVIICYDGFFPETVRILRIKGAHIIFNPSASTKFLRGWATKMLKVRAYENKSFVIAVNHGYPRFHGYSFAVNPFGKVIKRMIPWQNVGIVKLNLNLIEKTKKPLLTRRPSTYREFIQGFRP